MRINDFAELAVNAIACAASLLVAIALLIDAFTRGDK